MESKRKNVYITIFVITTIIASCVAVYFAIQFNSKGGENSVLTGEMGNVATDEGDKTETEVEIKEVEKIVEKVVKEVKLPVVDLENTEDSIRQQLENSKIRIILYGSHFSLETDIYGGNPILMFYDENTSSTKSINVSGIDKKIIDAKMGCPDKHGANWYVYFLLEDGSVAISDDIYHSIHTDVLTITNKVVKDTKIVRLIAITATGYNAKGIDENGKVFNLT